MTSTRQWPWDVLDVEANADERSVRRAYARLLKQQRPDEDPEAFQRLRYAYESALQMATAPAQPVQPPISTNASNGSSAAAPVLPAIAVEPPAHAPYPAPSTPPPAPTAPTTRETAAALWRAFLADENRVSSRHALNALLESVVSFSTRDELEWLALCECLNDGIPVDLRTSLCAVFGWRSNAAHLVRRDPFTAHRALAKVFADEDYATLRLRFPQAVALLEASPPRITTGLWTLRAAPLCNEVNQLLRALRHYYPNVAQSRFDPATLDFWAKCLSLRLRMTAQLGTAALLGALCGVLLGCALTPADQHHAISAWGSHEWFVAWAMVALNVGAAALSLFDAVPSLTRHLHALRRAPSLRYGWIVLWLAVSAGTLAAGPGADPGRLSTPTAMATLALCIEWALVLHGPLRSMRLFVFLAVQVAYGCGYFAHWISLDPGAWCLPLAHGALVALFCAYSLPTLREHVQHSTVWLRRLVVGWLICAGVFGALLASPAPNAPQWAWSLFAVLPVAGSILGKTPWRTVTAGIHRMVKVYLYLLTLMISLAMPNLLAVAAAGLMGLWMLNDLRGVRATRQATP